MDGEQTLPWRNAIVGYGVEAPDQLLAYPGNPKIHPQHQQVVLAAAISELGWLAPVIVNRVTSHVLDGHARIALALSRGEMTVPVAYVELPAEQEPLALTTFDPIGGLAITDREALDALLKDVTTIDDSLQAFLDGLAAKAGLLPPNSPAQEWQGMPAYEHEDQTAYQSLTLHFKDEAAVGRFAQFVGQKITPRTRFVWYPANEILRYADKRYAPES